MFSWRYSNKCLFKFRLFFSQCMYVCIHIYTHTHAHTHIQILKKSKAKRIKYHNKSINFKKKGLRLN